MADHVYKLLELTGTSTSGIDEAVKVAIERASKTIHHLKWFELVSVRGGIENGKVAHWQATIKVGFTLDE